MPRNLLQEMNQLTFVQRSERSPTRREMENSSSGGRDGGRRQDLGTEEIAMAEETTL